MNRILQLKRVWHKALFVLLLSVVGMTKLQAQNITFADANVKAICVTNWDTDGDGELNQTEAAAVTSLDGVFMFDDEITSFDELSFFTGLTAIGEDEFNSCTSLSAISIPNAVTSIGNYAFSDCSSLTSITSYAFVPPTLGNNVFDNVPSALAVNVPCGTSALYQAANGWSDLSNYEEFVFDLCPITFADDNVKAICVTHWDTNDDGELSYAEAAAVTNLGTSFKSTAITSFDELEYFTSLTSLPNTAFYGCTSLASITLPSSVSALGNGSFYNCTNLATMTVYAETPPTVGTNAFKNVPTSMVVHVPCGAYEAYHNANDWNVFSLFDPCLITFADTNVKALCVANWDTNGDGELSYAEAAAVTNLGTVFRYKSNISSFDELQYFVGLTSIGYEAFYHCSVLTSIEIPNSVTSIGNNAFYYCNGLTSIEIPNSVTSIGGYAFCNCSGLTSIGIPNSVTSIGSSAFSSCSGLEQIAVDSGNMFYDSRDNCNAIIKTSTNELVIGCKNTVIPNSVTSIGGSAFYSCSGLTSIDIPNSVTSIGGYAFRNCSGLTSIDIPNSVTYIGDDAFFYCSGLTSMTVLADNPPILGDDVFYGVYKGIPVYVPCGSLEAYQNALGWYEFNNYMPATACNSGEITATTYPVEGGAVTGEGYYDGGVICTITAIANSGYSFINWTKDGLGVSNSETYSFYVVGDASFTANFVQEGSIITFADSYVKALCVANWDTNGDGELSYAEAAAVTNLGSVFRNKNSISSFDELQYFVGLTSIGNNAFYYCLNLTSIEIPNSVTSIGNYAFSNCSSLTSFGIPNSVTSIGNYVFSNCSGLTSIEIPNSVTSIGNYAFSNCSGLTSIEISSSATYIGNNTFSNCSGLTSIEIPNSVTFIGANAFGGCSSLEQIQVASGNTVYDSRENCNAIIKISSNELVAGCKNTVIPNSVTSIGNYAFYSCTGLTSIEIPNTVTSIGNYAFYNCTGLTSIEIPNSVTSIGNSAFSGCSGLTSIEIPNSMTSIGGAAFYNCTGLISIEIPNSVTSIGNSAFSGCSGLTSIEIPNSVTTISNYAFSNCNGLKSVIVLTDNPPTISDDAFYGVYKGIPVYVSCEIEETYTTSHWGSFRTFVGLCAGEITVTANPTEGGTVTGGGYYENGTTFTITATAAPGYSFINWAKDGIGVPYPETYSFYVTGDASYVATFAQGTNITFADANVKALCVANWDTDGDGELSYIEAAAVTDIGTVFSNKNNISSFDELQYFVGLTSIGSYAFDNCTGLTTIKIPNSVTSINYRAFYCCTSLATIEIPNSVTSISSGAFYNCSGLATIEIPNSVTSISSYTFQACSGLTTIEIPNSVTSIGESAFYNCTGLTTIEIPNSVTSIGKRAFEACSGLTTIELSNSLTSINSCTFMSCSGLTTIEIPSSVTSIGSSAFQGCSGLTSIVIPNSVTSIGVYAFWTCSSLTSIEIPNSVTSIGNPLFVGCSSLEQIIVDSDNDVYDSRDNCNAIIKTSTNELVAGCKNTIIPNSVTSIGDYAFYNCISLISIEIPNSVTSIGRGAFYHCIDLTTIEIPNSVTSIGSSAFYYCSGLTSIEISNSVTSIGSEAFYNCIGLTTIEIPNSVTSIGYHAFGSCSGLTSMTVLADDPPTLEDYAFTYETQSIPVYVPCGSLEAYQKARGWNEFANYLPGTACDSGEITITLNPVEGGMVTGEGYYEGGDTCIITATANTGYYFMNWTENGTMVSCETSYSFIVSGDRELVANFAEGNMIAIGDESTATNNYLPSCNNYSYSFTQQIYTADEIGVAGTINCIAFYNDGAKRTRIYDFYLVATDKTSFTNNYNWVSVSDADKVFSGQVTMVANDWTIIEFDTPFEYNGISNIVLVTNDNTGSYTSSPHMACRVFNAEGNQAIRIYSYGTSYDPSSPSYYNGTRVDVKNQIMLGITPSLAQQTIQLSRGWNWFSTNVEITLDDLKAALLATGNTSITIKSKDNGSTTYNGTTWRGQLTTLDVAQMYRISVSAACEITLEGTPINPAEHPITISNGANWIAFPFSESITVNDAFAGFAVSGDVVKSKENGIATYNGSQWRGTLNTLVPGQGYIYKSAATGTRTFTFPTSTK